MASESPTPYPHQTTQPIQHAPRSETTIAAGPKKIYPKTYTSEKIFRTLKLF